MRRSTASCRQLVLFALVVSLCAACAAPEPSKQTVVQSYSVRAIVRSLPDASRPGTDLYVHHEAIPEFVDAGGDVVGMDSMAMPFPVADSAILDGIAVGDRVEMRFEVEWDGSPPLRVVGLKPLAEGTRLDFEVDPEADGASEPANGSTDPLADAAEPSHGDHSDHGEGS